MTNPADAPDFTPTGRITAVRAAGMSERQLSAALVHPMTSAGGKRTVTIELRKRRVERDEVARLGR